MENLLAEKVGFKQAGVPADLNTTGLTGARIKMDKGYRCSVIVSMGDSVGATVEVTLKQHNAPSAGTSKDLASAKPYFHKAGAATSFTKVTPESAAALKDLSAIFAAEEGLLVLDINAEELDINNGFTHFSVDIADPAAAKIFGVVYALHEVKYAPASELSL